MMHSVCPVLTLALAPAEPLWSASQGPGDAARYQSFPGLPGACHEDPNLFSERQGISDSDMCASSQNLLASKSPAVEIAELQKLVLKIFWSATYMGIPALLLQEPQFVGWMTSLLQAVKQPVPQVRIACCCGATLRERHSLQ